MEVGKSRRSSEGNLVNVGNFDDKGANVNRNKPDNHNDNLGVCFSRSVQLKGALKRPFDMTAFNPATYKIAYFYQLGRQGNICWLVDSFNGKGEPNEKIQRF